MKVLKILDKIDSFFQWIDIKFIYSIEELPDEIERIKSKVCRVIDYIPTIWNDRDFSFTPGSFELIKKKLEKLEPELIFYLGCERDRKRIKIILKLLDRVSNDYYQREFDKEHEKRWGKLGKMVICDSDIHNCNELIFMARSKVKTKEDQKQQRKELVEGMNKASNKDVKAARLVMDLIGRYGYQWYD